MERKEVSRENSRESYESFPLNSPESAKPNNWWEGIVVKNSAIPSLFSCFYPVRGITLWPFILLSEGCDSEVIINHERIHIAQANETFVLGMYVVWLLDFGCGCIKHGDTKQAYMEIRLEREAFSHQHDPDYLRKRCAFAWARQD